MEEAVLLMAKAPVPGRVKTRLCPPLSPAEAARLYSCMLQDTAEEIASLAGSGRYLFLDPQGAADVLPEAPFSAFERFPQRGKDLGGKMANAAATAFRRGARRVVITGGDCPLLTANRLRQAFRELREGAEAVFGPTADGGYYLVGLAGPGKELFRDIPWSTQEVLRKTADRCRAAGIPFSFLPPLRDVDTGGDLRALADWAETHPGPGCPRTRRWISGFFGTAGGGSPGRRARTPGPPRDSRSRREG